MGYRPVFKKRGKRKYLPVNDQVFATSGQAYESAKNRYYQFRELEDYGVESTGCDITHKWSPVRGDVKLEGEELETALKGQGW